MTDYILLENRLATCLPAITDDASLTDALYGLLGSEPESDAELIGESADMLASLAGETDEMTDASIDRVRASLAERIAAEGIAADSIAAGNGAEALAADSIAAGQSNVPARVETDAAAHGAKTASPDAKRGNNTASPAAKRGNNTAAPAANIARTRRGIRWRRVLPIAAAVALIAALTALTFAGSGRLADITNSFWKLIAPGDKLVESDYELEKMKDQRGYDEFEALLEAEGVDGVLVPKGAAIDDPLVVEYGGYREITATVTDESGRVFDYEAQYPSQADEINAELTRIGRFDVSLSSYDGVYQAEFIADGVWYVIGTDDPDALAAFVAALGE